MIGTAIATVLSPLWMTLQVFFFTVYTLPLKTINKILSLLGLPFDAGLLAECAIILYQYSMIALIIGSIIGMTNLIMFCVLRELFEWLDRRLRWDLLGKKVITTPTTSQPIKPKQKPLVIPSKIGDPSLQITIKNLQVSTEVQHSKPEPPPIKLPSSETNTTGASNKNFLSLHQRRPVSEETSTDSDTTMFNVSPSTITSITEHSEDDAK